MKRSLFRLGIACAAMVGLFSLFAIGCGGSKAEGTLEGSLRDVYNADFDSVRIRLYSSELSVEYLRSNGEIPVRATLKAKVLDRAPGEFEMPEDATVTGYSGRTRVPDVTQGTFTLEEFEELEGANIKGSFTAQFRAGDDIVVLHGRFEGPLEIVEDVFIPEVEDRDAGVDLMGDVTYLPPPDVDVQPPDFDLDGDGDDDPDPVCTVATEDEDCEDGEVCDEAADECVPEPDPDPVCTVATQDEDCEDGEICDEAADECVIE